LDKLTAATGVGAADAGCLTESGVSGMGLAAPLAAALEAAAELAAGAALEAGAEDAAGLAGAEDAAALAGAGEAAGLAGALLAVLGLAEAELAAGLGLAALSPQAARRKDAVRTSAANRRITSVLHLVTRFIQKIVNTA